MPKIPSLPRNITLHLTENCNLRCKICYYWGETGAYSTSQTKQKPKTLNFEIVRNLIRELAIVKPTYSLFGGEPLLYPYFEELIDEIKKNNSSVNTPTNGTLLSDNAELLVKKEFDLVRISLDGPREINDKMRGVGSYEKAIQGINDLFEVKEKNKAKKPLIDIIYTVTPDNFLATEEFFLQDLDISKLDRITIQMQNFITKQMGEDYAEFLSSEFGIQSDTYWKGLVRLPSEFNEIDRTELSRQVNRVRTFYSSQKKYAVLLPPTFSSQNLEAYLTSNWDQMTDVYEKCIIPWVSTEIVANGDVAPCHIFYDLVLGNLHENSIADIWNGEKYKKFRDYMESKKFMPICQGCCILYLAGKKLRKKR
jgi:radical SAM protein with 4Fe4S-binding SPASM domain